MKVIYKIISGMTFAAFNSLLRQGQPPNPTEQKTQAVAKGWQLRFNPGRFPL